MKKFLPAIFVLVLFSCKKNATQTNAKIDSAKAADSIDRIHTKYNDSIKNLNSKNQFPDISGVHHISHNMIRDLGDINFKRISGDQYEVSGNLKSGENSLNIKGNLEVLSDKYMNFTGTITQSISEYNNGKTFLRKGTMTFKKKNNETWELQNKINASNFVDYINIKF